MFRIDHVRWYQKKGQELVICGPPGFETTQYIRNHIVTYTIPNLKSWKDTDLRLAKAQTQYRLLSGCLSILSHRTATHWSKFGSAPLQKLNNGSEAELSTQKIASLFPENHDKLSESLIPRWHTTFAAPVLEDPLGASS